MRQARWAMALGVAAAILAFALPAFSQERDSDGTRMQARQVELDSTHSDRLDPPDEQADWRMIRLDEESEIKLELNVRPSNVSADLTLTNATGEELQVETTSGSNATIERTLLAGIYYIAVKSDDSLRYELSIR